MGADCSGRPRPGPGCQNATVCASPTAVLFDFGYTLFAHPTLAATIEAAGSDLGLGIDRHTAARLAATIDERAHRPAELALGRDLDHRVWRERFGHLYAIADDEHPGLGRQIYHLMHSPQAWIPYPATRATLEHMSRNRVRVAVVSNTGWDIRAVFAHHGLIDLVDDFVLSYEAGAVKPEAPIFRAALDALQVSASEALMVGDDPVADAGAQRCGIRTLLLPLHPPGEDNGVGLAMRLVGTNGGG